MENKVDYLISSEQCTGCMACCDICPKSAIEVIEVNGFRYPRINEEICVDCGACSRVCKGANDRKNVIDNKPDIYAIQASDEGQRAESSSGGLFSLIANNVISNGGVVYGAAFDELWEVRHVRATSIKELERIKKSKYVQSNTFGCYKQVEQDLKDGVHVLFSGTGCQCNALKSYLSNRNCSVSNLILVDFICHGVPSPVLWNQFVQRKQKKKMMKKIDFRDKRKSWRNFCMTYEYQDGTKESLWQNEDPFMVLFFHNLILRDSCHSCKYANLDRVADLTMGDFWGVWDLKPHLFDDKGISVCIVNSDIGRKVFDAISGLSSYEKLECADVVKNQTNLRHPSRPNPKSVQFWCDYNNYGLKYVLSKYADDNLLGRIKRKYIYKIMYNLGIWNIISKFREVKRHE